MYKAFEPAERIAWSASVTDDSALAAMAVTTMAATAAPAAAATTTTVVTAASMTMVAVAPVAAAVTMTTTVVNFENESWFVDDLVGKKTYSGRVVFFSHRFQRSQAVSTSFLRCESPPPQNGMLISPIFHETVST
jgi:hypothetical protein